MVAPPTLADVVARADSGVIRSWAKSPGFSSFRRAAACAHATLERDANESSTRKLRTARGIQSLGNRDGGTSGTRVLTVEVKPSEHIHSTVDDLTARSIPDPSGTPMQVAIPARRQRRISAATDDRSREPDIDRPTEQSHAASERCLHSVGRALCEYWQAH